MYHGRGVTSRRPRYQSSKVASDINIMIFFWQRDNKPRGKSCSSLSENFVLVLHRAYLTTGREITAGGIPSILYVVWILTYILI